MTSLLDSIKKVNLKNDGTPSDSSALIDVLAKLIAHDTSSSHNPQICKSNAGLIEDMAQSLQACGAKILIKDSEYPADVKQKTLVARIGPDIAGGIVLCGHTDVVSAAGQKGWKTDPFILERKDDKLFGRGASDMKGAIAGYLSMAHYLSKNKDKMEKPVYLAFTWGEEIGCKGSKAAAEALEEIGAKPEVMLVGEPTDGKLIVGHKGASTLKVTFKGKAGHSAYPEKAVSAINYAAKLVNFAEKMQQKFQNEKQYHHDDFDPVYPVINSGIIEGGNGGNVVAGKTILTMHARDIPIAGFLETKIVEPLREKILQLDAKMKQEAKQVQNVTKEEKAPEVGIKLEQTSLSHGLASQKNDPRLTKMVELYKKTMNIPKDTDVVTTAAFGTDAGGMIYDIAKNEQPLVIIYGPGAMAQHAHSPNEWVGTKQLIESVSFPMAVAKELCFAKEVSITNDNSFADKVKSAIYKEYNNWQAYAQQENANIGKAVW